MGECTGSLTNSFQRLTGALRRSLGNVTALHSLKNVVLGDLLSYTYNSRSASSYLRALTGSTRQSLGNVTAQRTVKKKRGFWRFAKLHA